LAVHPRYGEEVHIIRQYGVDAVWVETNDGKLTIIPISWTELRLRSQIIDREGQAVRFELVLLKELATLVEALKSKHTKQLDTNCGHPKMCHHAQKHSRDRTKKIETARFKACDEELRNQADPTFNAMVEQIGAPNANGRRN
jgi:hypothetical protein